MKKASAKSRPKIAEKRAGSAPPTTRAGRSGPAPAVAPDEIAPEYDFRGARQNPYASRYAAGALAVVLDPDVAAAFPTAAAVNEVLRTVAGLIREHPPAKRTRLRRSA